MPDRLTAVLQRALKRAAEIRQAKAKAKVKSADLLIAEDYAHRLAEKSLYRRLLSDERLDGFRFRWYFTTVDKSLDLDQLREWIDSRIAEEIAHDKADAAKAAGLVARGDSPGSRPG